MVFDSIVIEGAVIVDDSRGSAGILLRDKEGTGSVRTLRRTDSTGDKHFFKEIDEGIEAIVWDSVVATITVMYLFGSLRRIRCRGVCRLGLMSPNFSTKMSAFSL